MWEINTPSVACKEIAEWFENDAISSAEEAFLRGYAGFEEDEQNAAI